MNTISKAGALLLGAALAAGLAGCKKHSEDTVPAPVTAPETVPATPATTPSQAPATPTTPPSNSTTPPPDTTTPPATGTTPGTSGTSGTGGTGGTSGTSGTSGTTGAGQPPSTAPDKMDQKDTQRDRRPAY